MLDASWRLPRSPGRTSLRSFMGRSHHGLSLDSRLHLRKPGSGDVLVRAASGHLPCSSARCVRLQQQFPGGDRVEVGGPNTGGPEMAVWMRNLLGTSADLEGSANCVWIGRLGAFVR